MKKVIKSRIFLVIITVLICTSIGVYATAQYAAIQITYNKNGQATVDAALNDLYNRLHNNKIIDLTSKTSASKNEGCYSIEKVTGFIKENELFIRLKANKIIENCNQTFVIDISDLKLSSITYKKNFDLSNSINYYFDNTSNVNNIVLNVDTNYGADVKQNYDYIVYYLITK